VSVCVSVCLFVCVEMLHHESEPGRALTKPPALHVVSQPPTRLTSGWDLLFVVFEKMFNLLLGGPWVAPGWPAWGWKYLQDSSVYHTKSQPDRLHLTPIREGLWLGSEAFKIRMQSRASKFSDVYIGLPCSAVSV
jgi:hypothetical protein